MVRLTRGVGRERLPALVSLTLGLVGACVPGRWFPWEDARPVPAPAVAAQWWSELEQCSGLTGDFQAVRWYAVPAAFLVLNDQLLDGYWLRRENAVVFPQWRLDDLLRNGHIVRHELLHALLRREGHPGEFFGRRCGALLRRPR